MNGSWAMCRHRRHVCDKRKKKGKTDVSVYLKRSVVYYTCTLDSNEVIERQHAENLQCDFSW